MTRKHFRAVAAAVLAAKKEIGLGFYETRTIAQKLADELEQFNPGFDRTKFIRACESGE